MARISISFQLGEADGRYDDILSAANQLMKGDAASAKHAVALMCRQSALYKKARAKIRTNGKRKARTAVGQ